MAEGGHDRWVKLAHQLAATGRYWTVSEVAAALKAIEPEAVLPANNVFLSFIDSTCFRVRRENGWET
jgi:hypothetical protein